MPIYWCNAAKLTIDKLPRSWAETPESIEMKNHLAPDTMLFEGNRAQPTYRYLLARHWVEPNVSSSWDLRSPHYPYDPFNPHPDDGPSNLYDPDSDAYIGRTIDLDGVGGVATLVRADTHRFGAVFPSWLVDHQVETEGFGVMARRIGARIVGLPNYIIMHQRMSPSMTGCSPADLLIFVSPQQHSTTTSFRPSSPCDPKSSVLSRQKGAARASHDGLTSLP